jgi:hypothetical protein
MFLLKNLLKTFNFLNLKTNISRVIYLDNEAKQLASFVWVNKKTRI